MSTLEELLAAHQRLVIPDTAKNEELDEQIFMILDLETMVLAYAEATFQGIDPKFSLDTENLERMAKNVHRISDLDEGDRLIQNQLLAILDSLRSFRDLLRNHA